MTVADMKAAVSLAVEQAMRLMQTDNVPVVPAKKPAGDALREKRLAALEKARAAKKAKAKASPAPAAKPASKAAKHAEPGVVTIGGVECVPYDGGIVVRPKGRRRGIAFRKGDFALYAAFVNTIRSAECSRLTEAVVARTGR